MTVRSENGAVATLAISGDTRRTRGHHHYWERRPTSTAASGSPGVGRSTPTVSPTPHISATHGATRGASLEAIRSTAGAATVRDALWATAIREAACGADRAGGAVATDP